MRLLLPAVIASLGILMWGPAATANDQPLYSTFGQSYDSTYYEHDVIENDDGFLPEADPYQVINENEDVLESYRNLPKRIRSHGERVFIFSPRLLRWAAYDPEGYLVASGKANGGSSYCADVGRSCRTPVGSFRVGRKGDSSCVSSKFPIGQGGSPMPHCMFFHGGMAIHGSPYISNNNTSHGCIRVKTAAAKWLHRYFIRPGTKVVVLPYH